MCDGLHFLSGALAHGAAEALPVLQCLEPLLEALHALCVSPRPCERALLELSANSGALLELLLLLCPLRAVQHGVVELIVRAVECLSAASF